MILHKPDHSFGRIRSCWRRANSFAKKGEMEESHPLFITWSNVLLFLDANIPGPPPKKEKRLWGHKRRVALSHVFDITIMDWMAMKIDDYSKNNILKGDSTVSAILFEWKERMFFDPTMSQGERSEGEEPAIGELREPLSHCGVSQPQGGRGNSKA